jgi:glycosyltransferase involved in cell wall biosynthesis
VVTLLPRPMLASVSVRQGDEASVSPDDQDVRLSVILPVHQECKVMGQTISELAGVLSHYVESFEILAVDDGSIDGTGSVFRCLAQDIPSNALCIVTHPYNKGNGAAIRTGIRAPTAELLPAWMQVPA